MKTRDLFIKYCLIAALVLFTGTGLSAQVTIGGDKAPESFSALELLSSDGPKGLRLPHLTTAQRDALQLTFPASTADPNLSKGLMIYNTDLDCVQTWNGEDWISLCTGETPGDGGGGDPGTPDAPTLGQNGWATVNLSTGAPGGYGPMVVTAPAGSTVKWYNSSNQPIAAADGLLSFDPELVLSTTLSVGKHTYYAKVLKAGVESDALTLTYTVCGVNTNASTVKRFMCHDLGADQSRDPFVPHPDLIGNLYNWGIGTPAMDAATARDYHKNNTALGASWTPAGPAPTATVWPSLGNNMPCPPQYAVLPWSLITGSSGYWQSNTYYGSPENAIHDGRPYGIQKLGPNLTFTVRLGVHSNGSITGGVHVWSDTSRKGQWVAPAPPAPTEDGLVISCEDQARASQSEQWGHYFMCYWDPTPYATHVGWDSGMSVRCVAE